MKLSAVGEKLSADAGIVELMDDLAIALSENPDIILMGGGNPARIEPVELALKGYLEQILDDSNERYRLLGLYQAPQGELGFRKDLARFLQRQFGWKVTEKNIALANGSQSAFFLLLNMLAGETNDGGQRHIHLPLSPEYLGYRDVGLGEDFFRATQPEIDLLEDRQFKYRVNFGALDIADNAAALCVSRPTNPTGNVLTDTEMEQLDALARQHKIPLIVDGAYGLPFPNILFGEATPNWNENTIFGFSLSKLGLPGARTGIVVANEEFIRAFSNANTISSLACASMGPTIGRYLLKDDAIVALSNQHIRPFYKERAANTVRWLHDSLGSDIPYRLHKPEGAIFLWLWFDDLPISSQELYQRLKAKGLLVVPGEPFFIGLPDSWGHKRQCIRVSYAQEEHKVRRGVEIIGAVVRDVYENVAATSAS